MEIGTTEYNKLLGAGPYKTTARFVLVSGQSVVQGEVLGFNTSTGKLSSYDSGGSNGLNAFWGVAAEDVDATEGDTYCPAYVSANFKEQGLIFGTSGDSVTAALWNQARDKQCYIETSLEA